MTSRNFCWILQFFLSYPTFFSIWGGTWLCSLMVKGTTISLTFIWMRRHTICRMKLSRLSWLISRTIQTLLTSWKHDWDIQWRKSWGIAYSFHFHSAEFNWIQTHPTAVLYHAIVKSPDFRNTTDIFHFLNFISDLESMGKYSVGRDSTKLWLTEFLNYMEIFGIDYENLPSELDNYLETTPNVEIKTAKRKLWDADDSPTVSLPTDFYFSTGMWGIDNWPERAAFLKNLSALWEKYIQYEAAFFSEPIYLTDLLIYSEKGLTQTLGIALIVTFCMTLLFLPWDRPLLVFWVSSSFLSINAGVIGFLSLWAVDFDIISMVTLLMSVGFSVDYTVHLAYQYSRNLRELKSPGRQDFIRHKLPELAAASETFSALLRPILCSGISTLMAVFLMIFVKSYMVKVFLKTVVLVILLGLVQSFVVLPMLFILTARLIPQRLGK